MRRRRRLLGLLILPLAVIAAHTLLWRWEVRNLESGFELWASTHRAHGWSIRSGQPRGGGWPLAATLSVPGLSVEGGKADLPGGVAWSAERVLLTLQLLRPRQLDITADGTQRLRLGHLSSIPYTADRFEVNVPLEAGIPSHEATLEAVNLRAGLPVADGDVARGLTIGQLRGRADLRPAAPQGEPALGFTASAEAIGLPPGISWALGPRISSLTVEGALTGPLPRIPALTRRAEAWRDGGGTLEIQRLTIGWGPLGLTGTATLALDMRLQPMGTGTARVVGYAETFEALGAGGVISRRAAAGATALAALIARTPEGGGPAELEVPLTLQDRTLAIRQIPLARMPELTWPAE